MIDILSADLTATLPPSLRDDPTLGQIAKVIEMHLKQIIADIPKLTIYTRIDELPEDILDILAQDYKVDWWDYSASLEVKRRVMIDSWTVHRRLGTKWAVERVIESYFDSGQILEWFEYGGEPGHFKVLSSNPTVTNENVAAFLALLDKVKRYGQILDGIMITLTHTTHLSVGFAVRDISYELHHIGARTSEVMQ